VGNAYPFAGSPRGTFDRGPGSLPRVDERAERGRWMAKFHLPVLIVGWRSDGHGSFLGLVPFRLVSPPLEPRVVGPFSGTWCMVLQLFIAGGNRSYLKFWAITGGPRYPGYLP
jgi:hypothetical protein